MKTLMAIMALITLAACTPSAKPSNYTALPEELKDCVFFRLTNDIGTTITVARCPNSTTTVRQLEKAGSTSITVSN